MSKCWGFNTLVHRARHLERDLIRSPLSFEILSILLVM